MSILSPSGMETANYRAAGAVAIVNSNTQKLNTYLGKMMTATNAEITIESEHSDTTPVFHIKNSSGTKLFEILADGTIIGGALSNLIFASSQPSYTSLDDVRNKIFFGAYTPQIYYTSDITSLDLTDIYTDIELIGDTRPQAGYTWVYCASGTEGFIPHLSTAAGVGVGAVTLASSGRDITVTCSTTNPDFSFLTAGDKIASCNTSKAIAIYTVASASANIITLTENAPTINAYGCSITLIPNKNITVDLALTNRDARVNFRGFNFNSNYTSQLGLYIDGKYGFQNCCFQTTTSNDTVSCYYNADIIFTGYENTIFGNASALVSNGGKLVGAITLVGGTSFGGLFLGGGIFNLDFSRAVSSAGRNFQAEAGAIVNLQYSASFKAPYGFYGNIGGAMYARGSYCAYCTTYGYQGSNSCAIQAYGRKVHNNTSNQNGTVLY